MNYDNEGIKGLPSGEPIVILSKQEYDTLCVLVEETKQSIAILQTQLSIVKTDHASLLLEMADLRESMRSQRRKIERYDTDMDPKAAELSSAIERLIDEEGGAVSLGDVADKLGVTARYLRSIKKRIDLFGSVQAYQKSSGRKEIYFRRVV